MDIICALFYRIIFQDIKKITHINAPKKRENIEFL
jgi:hypothetical protein